MAQLGPDDDSPKQTLSGAGVRDCTAYSAIDKKWPEVRNRLPRQLAHPC